MPMFLQRHTMGRRTLPRLVLHPRVINQRNVVRSSRLGFLPFDWLDDTAIERPSYELPPFTVPTIYDTGGNGGGTSKTESATRILDSINRIVGSITGKGTYSAPPQVVERVVVRDSSSGQTTSDTGTLRTAGETAGRTAGDLAESSAAFVQRNFVPLSIAAVAVVLFMSGRGKK